MIKKILIALAATLVGFAVFVATRPADFRITRSAKISAPADVIFTHVNELKKWPAWSPWAKMDPQMKVTYSGPEAGVGASYSWVGNNDVGEGSMTITESKPAELVRFNLRFLKPMEATNVTDFTFTPAGDQTLVTWSMTGTNGFMGKAFSLIMNVDKLVGADFEKGLANLETVVKTPAPAAGE